MFEENMKKTKKTLVKICGLRRPEDAMAANCLKPDLAGFILSPGFRRSIDPEQAQRLRRILTPDIRTVGVFVDAPLEEIMQAAEGGWIDMIQLHGREDRDYITKLTDLTDLPLIKAFRIHEKRDLEAAAASPARWILLDSGTGTGKRFDWHLLESFLQEKAADTLFPGGHPWILAGGLSAENVHAAIERFHPAAVDVSSKVETDGFKDPAKMAVFLAAARM